MESHVDPVLVVVFLDVSHVLANNVWKAVLTTVLVAISNHSGTSSRAWTHGFFHVGS